MYWRRQVLGQCSPCEWGVLCAIAIWGLADVFRSADSDRWVFMTSFCLQKQKCSVYFSFQTRLEKLLAVPGAVQLFVKLFFLCCHWSAKERWDWSYWYFQKMGYQGWEMLMSSGILLTLPVNSGFFLLLAPSFSCCSSPWASSGAVDTVGSISLASLPLSKLPCKLPCKLSTCNSGGWNYFRSWASSEFLELLSYFQSRSFSALLSKLVWSVS